MEGEGEREVEEEKLPFPVGKILNFVYEGNSKRKRGQVFYTFHLFA